MVSRVHKGNLEIGDLLCNIGFRELQKPAREAFCKVNGCFSTQVFVGYSKMY